MRLTIALLTLAGFSLLSAQTPVQPPPAKQAPAEKQAPAKAPEKKKEEPKPAEKAPAPPKK